MKTNNSIIISERDYNDLVNMLESLSTSDFRKASFLEEEMLRAEIVESGNMPPEVVAMNSNVRFVDMESGEVLGVQVTYPWDSNIDEGKVSVLAPLGSALLGLGVGQEIAWPLPNGRTKNLRVVRVEKETESAVAM
ncbi:MAG TPA: nucleoside diphosphate kinase regulator [Oligoflexus sp.]|uniref:nucleoside diphosphate kinase regulator n=1 Tax=Oligoflexus sp. TaxID=1971216 RepID=UPI002D7EE587|nr:nucleoside diphosphate kinase regulator [Oligoflexus sp.]HET9240352.1 nucleoside diphosphate kinase regulator [Oligoflexus sp.]